MPRNHRTISSRNGAKSANGRTSYGSVGNPDLQPDAIVDADDLISPNEPWDLERLKEIKASMKKHGWNDRPLVALPIDDWAREYKKEGKKYVTVTGSHRTAAAMELGVKVPIIIVKDYETLSTPKMIDLLMKNGLIHNPTVALRAVRKKMSNPFTDNSVTSSNIRGPRRERNFNLADSIAVGLGSAIGGALGTSVAEPLIDRAKKWLSGRRRNGTFAEAQALSEAFHGREANEVIDVFNDYYNGNAAGLGKLVELHLMCDGGKHELPITFDDSGDRTVYVAAPHKRQIIFAGGDQQLDYELIAKECGMSPRPNAEALVDLGPVYQIVYFADKHHLEGPKQQKKGMQYFHNFGEESGILPSLFYDVEAEQMLLVGGNYHIEDVGIVD